MNIMVNNNKIAQEFLWFRAAAEKREVVVPYGSAADMKPLLTTTNTISSHAYHIHYYAGSLPYADTQTRCFMAYDEDGLHIRLEMDEPHLVTVLDRLADQKQEDFTDAEFVSLNILLPGGAIRQFMFKADARFQITLDGKDSGEDVIKPQFEIGKNMWCVAFSCPWSLLGTDAADFAERPIPFDLVRHRAALATITAWCPIPDSPPFSEQYCFPVFHFGLLATASGAWENWVAPSIDTGSLWLDGPTHVEVGEYLRLRYVYEVGKLGMQPGAVLRFALHNEVIECNRRSPVIRHLPEKDWSPLQWDEPAQAGFLGATVSRSGASISFSKEDQFAVTAHLKSDISLQEGDKITLEVGTDPSGPGLRAQLLTQQDVQFKFYVDVLGHGIWHNLQVASIKVQGGPAQRLVLHTPATPPADKPFELLIVAIDRYGNIADGYRGCVRLYGPNAVEGILETTTFGESDFGVARIQVKLPAGVVGVFRAVDETDTALNGESNLVVTTGEFGIDQIVFGDIHTHSQGSDGRLTPEEKLREVRHLRGCDCWALTDHCYDLTPARRRRQECVIDAAEQTGTFTVLPGYEWTNSMGEKRPWCRNWHGHRNVYFDRTPLSVFDGVSDSTNTTEGLKAALLKSGRNHVLINHFHCGDGTHKPGIDNGAEISGWATSFLRDTPGGDGYIGDVLDTGADTAVVAGSDHGTEAYYHGLPAELTAFYVSKLDRKHVFGALKTGRTYASTGVKTLLYFTVNGKGPQQGHTRIKASCRDIEIRVGSHLPVINVQIMCNGSVVKNLQGFDFGVKHYRWTDPDTGGDGYYMLRINVAQGHRVWSSPVFYEA